MDFKCLTSFKKSKPIIAYPKCDLNTDEIANHNLFQTNSKTEESTYDQSKTHEDVVPNTDSNKRSRRDDKEIAHSRLTLQSQTKPNNVQHQKKMKITKPETQIFNFSQDSFAFLEDTQALINKSKESQAKKKFFVETLNKKTKDTFPLKEISNIGETAVLNDFNSTQFYDNTQALKQIESAILSNRDFGLETDWNKTHGMNRSKENILPSTLVTPLQKNEFLNVEFSNDKLLNKDIENVNMEDSVCREMSNIFKSSQYRKEVDLLFEKVETSICNFGSSNNEVAKPYDNQSINDISWKDDSLITKAILDISTGDGKKFSDIIKKALLENAQNVATPQNVFNSTLFTCETFNDMGSFYGLPDKVKELMSANRGIDKLYDWQSECLNLAAVKTRKNLVYAMPTSGGKTLVAEILILREILCRKKNALFVLPFVAIVQEKVWSLSPFAVGLDFLIEEYAAGKGGYPPRKRRRKNSVYIATIEKAHGLINSLIDSGRLDELGLVVVDELHLIGDDSRGSTLESLLTKLIYVKENIQIVGMSATIGNLSEICQFLNADVYSRNFRPVELTEFIKCGNELAKINWNAPDENELLTFVRKADFSYSESLSKLDPDRLGGLVMEVVPKNSCLIFCSSKKNCENVAYLLCKVMFMKLREHRAKEKDDLRRALKEESGKLCNVLDVSVSFGVAYHHSGLTTDERRLIEEAFRSGVLSVICCTSTLAAGVNLPAKRVILRQPYVGRQFINLSRYKQMVGRAGRAGFGESGESILITTSQDLPKVKDLLMSPMDQALSFLHENDEKGLRHLFLSCISLGLANTRPQLQDVLNKSLLGVQRERFDVNIKKLTDTAIGKLFKMGTLQIDEKPTSHGSEPSSMDLSVKINSSNSIQASPITEHPTSENKSKLQIIVDNNSKFVISKLGAAAIKGGLELTKAHALYEDLLQAQRSLVLLDCLHLLYLITPYDVSEQIKPSKSHYFMIYSRLRPDELQTAKILGLTESCAVKMLNNRPIKEELERVLNRFYVTLMLYDLWNEVPVYEVSEKFQVARGLVQNLMTSAATFASNVVNFCNELKEFWAFVHLLKGMCDRLQHCCVKELVPLMELPSVKQGRAKQLYNAGYKTLASLAKADPNDLVQNIEYMSHKVANQLIATSKLLLLERVENLREEAEDVLDGIDQSK